MTDSDATKTLEAQRLTPLDLDPTLFRPDAVSLEFLHNTITTDDELLKQRAIEVQKEYVCIFL